MCAVLEIDDVVTGSIHDEILHVPSFRAIRDHTLAAFMYAGDCFAVLEAIDIDTCDDWLTDSVETELVHQLSQLRREIKFVEQLLLPF